MPATVIDFRAGAERVKRKKEQRQKARLGNLIAGGAFCVIGTIVYLTLIRDK